MGVCPSRSLQTRSLQPAPRCVYLLTRHTGGPDSSLTLGAQCWTPQGHFRRRWRLPVSCQRGHEMGAQPRSHNADIAWQPLFSKEQWATLARPVGSGAPGVQGFKLYLRRYSHSNPQDPVPSLLGTWRWPRSWVFSRDSHCTQGPCLFCAVSADTWTYI